ncbi:MAG: redoxin domain-containing protein [Acidimicrobiia bacterium]|nr:redoxin domain-containing protein [Acidimicrobiia bacterium]
MRRSIILVGALALVVAACSNGSDAPTPQAVVDPQEEAVVVDPGESFAGTEPAPEFGESFDWLNTGGQAIRMEDLKGKVVLLDFWTYGCINCIHIIPDLKALEAEYPEELVVIGVHSAKFANESATDNIRQVILRYGIEHPVVNDRDFEIWRNWGAQAWPTVALVDPAGNVVGVRSGEGVYEAVQPVIEALTQEFQADIVRTSLDLRLESEGLPSTILSFPGKVTVDPDERRIFVADTNHNRIVEAALPGGEVLGVYGSGKQGFADGTALGAQFNQPQGMALSPDSSRLYVADTNNHAVRVIDLVSGDVSTVTGTGRQAQWPPTGGPAPATELASPWDVLLDGDRLFIAMAGTHQIWEIQLEAGVVAPFAGSAREGSTDGAASDAALAQPSGLALDDAGNLYFADSESSSIRFAQTSNGTVDTVAGAESGLFEFGDVDGFGREVRLQHPLGVAWAGDRLFVADTYNSKIKVIDVESTETLTFAGGEAGWADGVDTQFYEPGGIDFAGTTLYVADTNNHAIRMVNGSTGQTTTLILKGIEAFEPPPDAADYKGTVVDLPPATVAPGAATIAVDIELPEDHKVNEEAPSSVQWLVSGGIATFGPDADRSLTGVKFPVEFDVTFNGGNGVVVADMTVVWCADNAESLCFIDQLRLSQPLEVAAGGAAEITLAYTIELLDF